MDGLAFKTWEESVIRNPPGPVWGENARHGTATSEPRSGPEKGDCG